MSKKLIEIKRWDTGEIIISGKYESVKDCLEKNSYANLSYANLSYANLYYANLSYSNLSYANLSYANLSYANLSYANLSYSNLSYSLLSSANLSYAKWKEPLFLSDLYSLKLLPANTVLTFWKYLKNGKSPYQSSTYQVGKVYKFDDCSTNEQLSCESGNVATLMWCLKDNLKTNEFLKVEFKVKNIGAIPYTTDGKFRVKKFKVLGKFTRKQALNILNKAMNKGGTKRLKK